MFSFYLALAMLAAQRASGPDKKLDSLFQL
jgi:hypothetical protein